MKKNACLFTIENYTALKPINSKAKQTFTLQISQNIRKNLWINNILYIFYNVSTSCRAKLVYYGSQRIEFKKFCVYH